MTTPLYCPYAEHALATTPTGYYIPCCEFTSTLKNKDGKLLNVHDYSINEAFNSDALVELRNQLSQGIKHPGCASCWTKEDAGLQSKRTTFPGIKVVSAGSESESKLYTLDLKLGNTCNLKCRSCNSYSSSKWKEDDNKLLLKKNKILDVVIDAYSDVSNFWSLNEVQTFANVSRIEFTGGEPFLVKNHIAFLEFLVEANLASKIHIQYNTNGTVTPSSKLEQLWQQFKTVEIVFSIDGIGKKFEYLRHPGKFVEFKNNVDYISSLTNIKLKLGFCYTVTLFNILYTIETLNYIKQTWNSDLITVNIAFGPKEFNIINLSQTVKNYIKTVLEINLKSVTDENLRNNVNNLISYMMSKESDYFDNLIGQEYFYYQIFAVDKIRGESFAKTFPELNLVLSYIFDNVTRNVHNIKRKEIKIFINEQLNK